MAILLLGASGNAYNISAEQNIVSVKELAELISAISGMEIIFDIDTSVKSGFNQTDKIIMSPAKIGTLGWQAQCTLETGLRKTIAILKSISMAKNEIH
jgi:nucleoside-diphosphate-sugar epimerase